MARASLDLDFRIPLQRIAMAGTDFDSRFDSTAFASARAFAGRRDAPMPRDIAASALTASSGRPALLLQEADCARMRQFRWRWKLHLANVREILPR
jgi:hypothetical protein